MIVGHQKQWDFLETSFENEQMAHAYLFCGENQIGKKTLAIELIKLLNCLENKKDGSPVVRTIGLNFACGKCKNCVDIEKGNFLDFLFLRTGEESINFEGMFSYNSVLPDLKTGEVLIDKKEIGIDQARKAIEFLSKRSYFGGWKAVIIDNAEKLTIEAQNCLLKTLEEPKGKTILILVTSQPDRLLTTIFSRCQVIKFFATKEILKVAKSPEQIKKENEILSELLKIISGTLAEKFAYTKNIKEDPSTSSGQGATVLEIMKILQKHFRKELLQGPSLQYSKAISLKLNLIDDLIYKITFTNASPKLALEILFLEI